MTHMTDDYAGRLRRQGYRLTPQRRLILDALCDLGGHVTINALYDEVQRRSPAVDRATVYRALHLFETLHLVVSAEIEGQTVYEIAAATPHHHLVCQVCGRVEGLADHHLTPLAQHLLHEHGFELTLNHLTLSGVCRRCRPAASPA